MTARNLLLALLTLSSIAACIALPFIPQNLEPFDATSAPGEPALVILPSSLGLAMPAGVQAGDKVYFTDLAPRDRSFFMTGGLNSPAGTTMDLALRRADGVHHVTVTFQPAPFLSGSTGNRITQMAGYALMLLVTALGLLLLWRAQNMAAVGVALWCFTLLIQDFFSSLPMPLPFGLIVNRVAATAASVGTLVGLYLVAVSLTITTPMPRAIRTLSWAFAAVLVFYSAGVAWFDVQFYLYGLLFDGANFVRITHLVGFAIPLVLLVGGYRRAATLNQARTRWVLFSLLGLVATYMLGIIPQSVAVSPVVFNVAGMLLTAASFTGFAYAVLRHRLVSLQLVLNRALVYGLITSLVVGVFAAMLSFLERTTLNTEGNRFLALLVPLLLGMGLDTLKRRVNDYIGKLFFRHRHRAEAALTQLARTSAFVEDPERLLDLAADELYANSRAQALWIYLNQPGKGATPARRRGQDSFPAALDNDDPALLRLRAGDVEVDLAGCSSRLGREGYVYGLAVRGEVLGFIVCGARPAEAYSPEERRLYAQVAQQVGLALHTLRLQEQQRLLRNLAEGAFQSLPSAQAEARSLMGLRTA